MEIGRELDAKTAWELYKKVDGFANKIEEMDKRQAITLQEMKAEQRAAHYEMLDAVDRSVDRSARYMEEMVNGLKIALKAQYDEHEKRLIDIHDTLETHQLELTSLQTITKPIPRMIKDIDCLQSRPGGLALKAWQKALAAAGALMLIVAGALVNRIFL